MGSGQHTAAPDRRVCEHTCDSGHSSESPHDSTEPFSSVAGTPTSQGLSYEIFGRPVKVKRES